MESVLDEFLAVQLEIEYLITESESENESKAREEFENDFYHTIARAESLV